MFDLTHYLKPIFPLIPPFMFSVGIAQSEKGITLRVVIG